MEKPRTIDAVDYQILTILQEKARIPNAEVARKVGMAPSAVLERVRKLETQGIIEGYEVRVNPRCVGLGLIAFVRVLTDAGDADGMIGRTLAALPQVQEVHQVAGEDGYLVKIRVADHEALGTIVRTSFQSIPGVRGTRSEIALTTLKETLSLPLDALSEERAAASNEKPASSFSPYRP